MTQHWGPPPNYPPPRPPQPRYRPQLPAPPGSVYRPPVDMPVQRVSYFMAGSCVSLIVFMLCCICTPAFLWVVDDSLGITARIFGSGPATEQSMSAPPQAQDSENFVPTPTPTPQPEQAQLQADQAQLAPAPTPTLPHLPFAIGQPILSNDTGVELTVWDIQRTVQPLNLAPADGLEFAAVSVQLRNIRPDGVKRFELTDFLLQDAEGNVFLPDPNADNGRRLEGGEIPVDGLVEGDLLFYIPLGQAPLALVWQATNSEEVYSILLQ